MSRPADCCGCFNLRDGSRAIGITMLVLNSLCLAALIAGAVRLGPWMGAHLSLKVIMWIALTFAKVVSCLITSALLVYGVSTSRHRLLWVWLINSAVVISIQCLELVIAFIVVCAMSWWWLLLAVFVATGLNGVFFYWFEVVHSYYQQLRKQDGLVYSRQDNVAL